MTNRLRSINLVNLSDILQVNFRIDSKECLIVYYDECVN